MYFKPSLFCKHFTNSSISLSLNDIGSRSSLRDIILGDLSALRASIRNFNNSPASSRIIFNSSNLSSDVMALFTKQNFFFYKTEIIQHYIANVKTIAVQ